MRRSIDVEIAGQRLALRSDADETYVASLAGFVEDRIRAIQRGRHAGTFPEVAVLAALQIADELLRERRGRADLRRRVRARVQGLLDGASSVSTI